MKSAEWFEHLTSSIETLRGRTVQRFQSLRPQRLSPSDETASNLATTDVIVTRLDSGVLRIHLAGGARRNVLGRATVDRIENLVEHAPSETRLILLTADGPDFCAGYDLVEAGRIGAESLIANEVNFEPLRRSAVPIVAALQGNVIGGGLELALAADVRIAAVNTRLAIPASQLGLIYSEAGVRLLVSELGESIARAMLIAGRAVSANEGLTSGLFVEVVAQESLETRAIELAEKIASWSPLATAGNRRMLDVVAGRVEDDTELLRLKSFAPNGDLAASIERFTARHSGSSPVHVVSKGSTGRWEAIDPLVQRASRGIRHGMGRMVHGAQHARNLAFRRRHAVS